MSQPSRSLMVLREMEGWLTFPEAAAELSMTTERIRQMATSQPPKLTTAVRVGRRPLGLVREAEVREMKLSRSRAAE